MLFVLFCSLRSDRCWLIEVGCSSCAVCSSFVCCLWFCLIVVCCSLFVVRCALFVVCCLFFVVRNLLFVVCRVLLSVVRCVLCVA